MDDEEVCREGLPWVEDGQRSSLRGDLWFCSAIDEGIGAAGCRGLLGQDDEAKMVRYANFSANLEVFLLTG
jgi:hypothetical protein